MPPASTPCWPPCWSPTAAANRASWCRSVCPSLPVWRMADLIRLDCRPVPDTGRECRAFMVVRDERLRLPYALDYHRRLGTARFFIADNVSNDGTVDYLLAQPDCHVY